MQGWLLFRHALTTVWGSLGQAVKLSVLPSLIFLGVVLNAAFAAPDWQVAAFDAVAYGDAIALSWIGTALIILSGLWFAVCWHRFVLLEDSTALRSLHGRRAALYLARVVQTVLVCVPLIAGIILAWTAIQDRWPDIQGLAWLAVDAVVLLPLVYVLTRLSPLLPAAALDHPTTVLAAWRATAPGAGAILIAAVIQSLALFAIDGVLLVAFPAPSVPGLVAYLATEWLYAVVGVSLLTTVYGHYVEGRALD